MVIGQRLMLLKPIIYFLIFVLARQGGSYSWHSTITEFMELVKTEKELIQDIKTAMMQRHSGVNRLLTQINALKSASTKSAQVPTKDRSSADIYKERLGQHQELLNLQDSSIFVNFSKDIYNTIETFPNINDMRAVIDVLLRLQQSSVLNTSDLANGRIMEASVGRQLTARSCHLVAEVACEQYYHYDHQQCAEWCEEARAQIHNPTAKYTQDDLDKLLYSTHYMMQKYSKLCSASINQSYIGNPSSKLKCFLWNNNDHPWLVLQPIRAELLSVDPTVVLFYNIISNEDIDYIKKMAKKKLGTAVTATGSETVRIKNDRITHNCWFDDNHYSVVQKLSNFAEILTNLPVVKHAERLQVANYGVGGLYKPHLDAFINENDPSQSIMRRATLMYYLSDVQYGGATAFPLLNMAVKPKMGTAVFWHNLVWDTGLVNKHTTHGACPVVLGDKWVANKWIGDRWNTTPLEHEYYI